jgi:hypothetical protein
MKCKTPDCFNQAIKYRLICGKCRTRKYREKYPLKYWYDTLKMNAKRRGKEFDLTLEQFSEFCKKTGYDEKKGKTADSLSVDRIKPWLGYSANNIRAITLSDNTKIKNNSTYEIKEICPF